MRKMGEAVVREGEGTRCENVSRERLDMSVISYKHEDMKQEEETNLVLIEVEVGARELDQDELVPQPVHWGGVGDVDRVRRTSATGEEGNELALGIADDGSRVPAPRERGKVLVLAVWQDCGLDGFEGTGNAVQASLGLEETHTTNRGGRLVAVLDDESNGNAVEVLGGGLLDLLGGENALELEEVSVQGVFEVDLVVLVDSAVHHAHKIADVDLISWNESS